MATSLYSPRRRAPRGFQPPPIGGPLNINPESAMPLAIPQIPEPDYDAIPPQPPAQPAAQPTPAADAYRQFIQSQQNPELPGLGRRIALGALGGAAETMGMRGVAQQAQMGLMGIDPAAGLKQKALSDLAQLESETNQRAERARLDESTIRLHNAQVDNLRADNEYQRGEAAARRKREEWEARNQYNNTMERISAGTAASPGMVREVPTVPGATLPPPIPGMLGEMGEPSTPTIKQNYTRFSFTNPKGQEEEFFQPPPPLPGSGKLSYREQNIAAAQAAKPATMIAIDSLNVPEDKKVMLRAIIESAAASGDIPAMSRAALGEVSNLNIRGRVMDQPMINARGQTARVVGQQGALGRVEGEQQGLGGEAAAGAIQEEVETGQRTIPEVPNVFKGKVAEGMQGAGTMAIPQQARGDMRKLDAVKSLLDQWETAALEVNKYYGLQAVVYGVGQRALAAAQAHPKAQLLESFKSRAGQLSRGLGQEVGVATEGDINRALAGVGEIGESEVATKQKFGSARETIENNRKIIIDAYTKKYPRGSTTPRSTSTKPPPVPGNGGLGDPLGVR